MRIFRIIRRNKIVLKIENFVRHTEPLMWLLRSIKSLVSRIKFKLGTSLFKNKGNRLYNSPAEYFERISSKIKDMPVSNGGRYYQKFNYKIGIITDDFLYDTFKDAADFKFIYPNSWQNDIKNIDAFLIITGWKGLKDEWQGCAIKNSTQQNIIYNIIEKCNSSDIPTFFYSIEDPPNYDRFITVAQKCRYVFTTAAEVVENYKRDCGHDRVYALRFGINPLFHNPVGFKSAPKIHDVIFSGSWMEKYPQRGKDLTIIFNGILNSGYGLKIIDRNYHLPNAEYKFPKQFEKYTSPAIDHENLQKVHKLYDWAVNINSVKDSRTMFANRVYELQASGNLLISNYSVGVNSYLPGVFTVQNSDEVKRILDSFSEEEIYRRQIAGIRFSMTGETCFDRLSSMLKRAELKAEVSDRSVLVIGDNSKKSMLDMFERQTYQNKTFVSKDEAIPSMLKNYDIITFFGENVLYSEFYLEDMINGFKYTDCDYITKAAFFFNNKLIKGTEHNFVNSMESKYRTVFWSSSFEPEFLLSVDGKHQLKNGYSIDRFNCVFKEYKPEYLLSVIVPVYNNGKHLYGKAFASLMRSSMFNKMEIILVDDGSSDDYTVKIVSNLEKTYDNVRAFYFNDGGSGSASRPRNKGVEIATSKYITFLDPDNEAISDGYARLYDQAVNGNFDLTVGNIQKYTTKEITMNYYHYFKDRYGSDIVEGDKKDFLGKINFCPMSIQAMVIKKELIDRSGIEEVVGAVGQDSLFSWQLLYYAKRIKAIDLPIHIYYAMTAGSVTNVIKLNYFKKQALLETDQVKWLLKENLIDIYMSTRFNVFIKDWIFTKLAGADLQCGGDCAQTVYKSLTLYKDYYNNKESIINKFMELCASGSFSDAYDFIVKEKQK